MCTDIESRREICRSLFNYLGRNPGTWWLSSVRLKKSADVLRQNCWLNERSGHDRDIAAVDFEFGPVYMLLMGMAVEAALKAILVAKNPELVGEQQILHEITTHRLKCLWEKAELRPYPKLYPVLDDMEGFVVSFGRYPVSRTRHDMENMAGLSFHAEPDFDRVTQLWCFVEKQTRQAIPELFTEDNSDESDTSSP